IEKSKNAVPLLKGAVFFYHDVKKARIGRRINGFHGLVRGSGVIPKPRREVGSIIPLTTHFSLVSDLSTNEYLIQLTPSV
ncbi:MAG: hypothetical protein WCF67_08855, partial [Chitinophagaceae bacterium]